jgi:spoIIIJ-associated protein
VEWVETTGRTIEDAKEAALDELGVDESDAEFEVLEEARAGLFGRLRSEARVRARVRPTAPRAKEDRRDRRRRNRAAGEEESGRRNATTSDAGRPASAAVSGSPVATSNRGEAPGGGGAAGASEPPAAASAGTTPAATAAAGASGGGASAGGASAGGAGAAGATAATTDPGSAGDGGSGGGAGAGKGGARHRRRRSGRGSPADSRPAPEGSDAPESTDRDEAQDVSQPGSSQEWEDGDVEVALEEQAQVAQEFLTQLTAEFGVQADVEVVRPDEDTVDLHLRGSDLGLLIGPKGSTLLAIQDLTRTVVHHQTGAGNGRIHVDVGGYRQKRAEALGRFAQQVATTVKQTGTRTVLEPMSAADRKVVHDAITHIEGVSTVSEGEEPRRRVVVLPTEEP